MGNKQTATHMSLYLDSSPEALANLPVAYQTSFLLTLHGHDGAPDVVKGAPMRAATRHIASDAPARRSWDAKFRAWVAQLVRDCLAPRPCMRRCMRS